MELKSDEDCTNRVRSLVNQITPENFAEKGDDLRKLLIGNAILLNEEGFKIIEAKNFKINEEKLDIVV